MKTKIFLTSLIVVVPLIAYIIYLGSQGPSLSEYEHLLEPTISARASQNMLVIEARGDPAEVADKAYERLFAVYNSMEGIEPWPGPTPRTRWLVSVPQPREEWIGVYGLPIPDTITEIPEHVHMPALTLLLATWTYGEVAEILHVGPYDQEQPSWDRLNEYITARGYMVNGPPEEEYVKGPGVFFAGNPDNYLTIIRYEVKPVPHETAVEEGAGS